MIIKKFIAATAACTLIGNFLPTLSLGNTQYVMTANAYTRGETDEFTYVNMGANIKISMAKSPSGVLNIPSDIGGFPVTDIMMQAFQDQPAITAVNLPDTLTSIDFMAFANCTGLTSVTLPKSLKYLEDGAFMNCFGITTVTIYSRDCQIAGESSIPEEAVIYGYSGSTAETYARSYGRSFIALPDEEAPSAKRYDYQFLTLDDETQTPLKGVTFKLSGVKADGTPITFEENQISLRNEATLIQGSGDSLMWISGTSETMVFLESGTYTLCNEAVPDGYMKEPDNTFTISENPPFFSIMWYRKQPATTLPPPITTTTPKTTSTTSPTTYTTTSTTTSTTSTATSTSTTTSTTSTTTTTTTSEPPATTTVTTNVVPPVSRRVGDTSGDGEISPLDASMALVAYAVLSTGGTYEMCGITDENFYIYDVDNNGEISPMDSSLILSFYAYLSTGGIIEDMSVWMNQK